MQRNHPMKILPLETRAQAITPAAKPPREHRCENCHFWDRDQAQQLDKSQPGAAPCLRYPPTIVVVPVPVMRNPRMIVSNPAAQVPMEMVPQPVPVLPFSQATGWCGEYKPYVADGVNGAP